MTGDKLERGSVLPTNKIGEPILLNSCLPFLQVQIRILHCPCIDYIRLSTTVATNALLERTGQPHALLITAGFRDLLLIGNQSRPKIFDLNIRRPPPLYDGDNVVEVEERVTLEGFTSDPKGEEREREVQWGENGEVKKAYGEGVYERLGGRLVKGDSGEAVRILKEPGKYGLFSY